MNLKKCSLMALSIPALLLFGNAHAQNPDHQDVLARLENQLVIVHFQEGDQQSKRKYPHCPGVLTAENRVLTAAECAYEHYQSITVYRSLKDCRYRQFGVEVKSYVDQTTPEGKAVEIELLERILDKPVTELDLPETDSSKTQYCLFLHTPDQGKSFTFQHRKLNFGTFAFSGEGAFKMATLEPFIHEQGSIPGAILFTSKHKTTGISFSDLQLYALMSGFYIEFNELLATPNLAQPEE